MPSSVFYYLSDQLLLEYIYGGGGTIRTDVSGVKKVFNGYDGQVTYCNDDGSLQRTGNVSDYVVQELPDGRSALLDNDSAYYYPDFDPTIVVSPVTVFPIKDVQYDRIRIHMISGYGFDGKSGMTFSAYLRTLSDKVVRLCNLSYVNGDNGLLFVNPRPIRIQHAMYDKYIEALIPSAEWMITEFENSPVNSLAALLGVQLSSQRLIYFSFSFIDLASYENGLVYFQTSGIKRLSFGTTDGFSLLTAYIAESPKGPLVEYCAKWDGNTPEDMIYKLNSVSGNNFYIIHELTLTEQIGESMTVTDSFTSIQDSDYNAVREWKPIVKRAGEAVAVSIDYAVRLHNAANGTSIVKRASLTILSGINRYGYKVDAIVVGNVTQPLKVYNKVITKDISVLENLREVVKNRVVYSFVDRKDVVVGGDPGVLEISQFDNTYVFRIRRKVGDLEEAVDFTNHVCRLCFVRNDGSMLRVVDVQGDGYNRSAGELAFMVTKTVAKELTTFLDTTYHITVGTEDGIETVAASGTWTNK
jgi:hypothetical protein